MTNTYCRTAAPENYEIMHRQYFQHIIYLCGVAGIAEHNQEDVASEIFVRLMERDFLTFFDPDLVFEYKGVQHPARFKSFLSTTVNFYLRGHLDKERRLAKREWLTGPTTGSASSPGQSLPDSIDPDHADEVIEMVTEESDAQGIRKILADVPRRCGNDRCDLVALYDAVRTQILKTGRYDIKALQQIFGVSATAMHTWMWWLKANLADAYGVPLPAKRPRRSNQPRIA